MPPDVPRETRDKLDGFVRLLLEENGRQNLIAASTVDDLWSRHIEDGLQLSQHLIGSRILDIGSGPGLPGLVLAIVQPSLAFTLAEPRTRRADFMRQAATTLALPNVTVETRRIEALPPLRADTITARAVAPLDRLLAMSLPHASPATRWLLPKGRRATEEVEAARRSWQGRFALIPSITDPEASIVMAHDIQRRTRR